MESHSIDLKTQDVRSCISEQKTDNENVRAKLSRIGEQNDRINVQAQLQLQHINQEIEELRA